MNPTLLRQDRGRLIWTSNDHDQRTSTRSWLLGCFDPTATRRVSKTISLTHFFLCQLCLPIKCDHVSAHSPISLTWIIERSDLANHPLLWWICGWHCTKSHSASFLPAIFLASSSSVSSRSSASSLVVCFFVFIPATS